MRPAVNAFPQVSGWAALSLRIPSKIINSFSSFPFAALFFLRSLVHVAAVAAFRSLQQLTHSHSFCTPISQNLRVHTFVASQSIQNKVQAQTTRFKIVSRRYLCQPWLFDVSNRHQYRAGQGRQGLSHSSWDCRRTPQVSIENLMILPGTDWPIISLKNTQCCTSTLFAQHLRSSLPRQLQLNMAMHT